MSDAETLVFNGLRGELRYDEPLARYTSWRVGGPARRCFRPADLDDLCTFLHQLPAAEPLLWLGLGSNVLIRDGGFPGTVILTSSVSGATLQNDGTLRIEAGMPCPRVAKFCARHDRVGAEFLAGIPGTLGGALAMNAGAWGGETWDWVSAVETVDRDGRLQLREPEEFDIGYRHCALTSNDQGTDNNAPTAELFFVAAHLWLQPGDGVAGERRIRELLERRTLTQPTGTANCGSVFRNPQDDYAARLIESVDLKGFSIGGASVSSKHANFIINNGQATASDLETLIEWVISAVAQRYQVRLRPEVRIIGERATTTEVGV